MCTDWSCHSSACANSPLGPSTNAHSIFPTSDHIKNPQDNEIPTVLGNCESMQNGASPPDSDDEGDQDDGEKGFLADVDALITVSY